MIPFSGRTDNKCQVMLWKSPSLAQVIVGLCYNAALGVIDNFRLDHAKISYVYMWRDCLVEYFKWYSSRHTDLSLHVSRYRHWGFLSSSSLPSVGEKKNNTRKTATAWPEQEGEHFQLRSRYSVFRCSDQFFVNSLPQGVVHIELKLSRKATKMLNRHTKV